MIDDDAGHRPTPKSGCRRAAGCFGWLLLFVLVVLFLPPQISRLRAGDLRPAPQPKLAETANGLTATLAVVKRLDGKTPASYVVGDLDPQGRAWVDRNAGLLPDFDRAVALPEVSCPWGSAFLPTSVSGFREFREGVRFGCIAAAMDAADGQAEAAAQRLIGMLHVSQGVMTSRASTIATLVGLAGEAMTLRDIQAIVDRQSVAEEAWSPLRAALASGPSAGDIVAATVQGEYHFFYVSTAAPDELPAETDPVEAEMYRKQDLMPSTCFYDRWRTLDRYRAVAERVAGEARKPRPQRDRAFLDRIASASPPSGFDLYNAVGEQTLVYALVNTPKVLDRADYSLANRRLTATMIALRIAYDRDGKLPVTLNDLVTTGLLDAVPADPFDERPLRYDLQRALLWSIGENEQDDDGVASRGTGMKVERLDIVVPLAFAKRS